MSDLSTDPAKCVFLDALASLGSVLESQSLMFLRFCQILGIFSGYVQMCSNVFKHVQTCSKLVQMLSKVFKCVQTCSKLVQMWSNVFKCVQTCSPWDPVGLPLDLLEP